MQTPIILTDRSSLLGKLFGCQALGQLEECFDAARIDSLELRTALLRQTMGATLLHDHGAEPSLSARDDYEYEAAIFVEGSWRSLQITPPF